MTRIVGIHTKTTEKDLWSQNHYGWVRVQLIEQRTLHATKGWRGYHRRTHVIPIKYPRGRSFGSTIVRQQFSRC